MWQAVCRYYVGRCVWVLCGPPKGGRGFLMSSPCLESRVCQFDPTFLLSPLLFFYLVLLLFNSGLSFFGFWPTLLTSFSINLHFRKGKFFCVALGGFFSQQLGDEYFGWWYVQHMQVLCGEMCAGTMWRSVCRYYVISRMPKLEVLDYTAVTADERSEATRIYGASAAVSILLTLSFVSTTVSWY